MRSILYPWLTFSPIHILFIASKLNDEKVKNPGYIANRCCIIILFVMVGVLRLTMFKETT